MHLKKLFLIFFILVHPVSNTTYEKPNNYDGQILAIACATMVAAGIAGIAYNYFYYWDYSLQKSNTHNLDFLVKSHEQADQIEELIQYLHDPINHAASKHKYSTGILFSGDTGPLFVQALSNQLKNRCFYIDVFDFLGHYELNYSSGQIKNLHQSAGNVTSFFNYVKRQKTPCLIILSNLEDLHYQTLNNSNQKAELEKYLYEEFEAIQNQISIEIQQLKNSQAPIVYSAMVSDQKALAIKFKFSFTNVFNNWYLLDARTKIIDHLFKSLWKYIDISPYEFARRTTKFTEENLLLLREQIMNSIVLNTDKIKLKTASEIIDDFTYGKVQNTNNSLIYPKAEDNPELKITAYHESGHALISMIYNNQFTLDKVSILARDAHLGLTQSFNINHGAIMTQEEILNEICLNLAGYAGEEMLLSKNTIWKESSDYQRAYELACIVAKKTSHSDPLKIIDQEYTHALKLLKQYEKQFKTLAQALIEHKVLMADEIYTILNTNQ